MQDEKDRPNRALNTEQAEGGRWTSDPDAVEVADRYAEGVGKTNEHTGGISNRELSEEFDRQASLPGRGTSRNERNVERDNEEGDVER